MERPLPAGFLDNENRISAKLRAKDEINDEVKE